MAKLSNNVSILAALLSSVVAASMLSSPVAAEKVEIAPSPFGDGFSFTIPPEPEPGFYEYLEGCVKKISPKCGEDFVTAVFQKSTTKSNKCCHELVAMGKTCHNDLVEFYLLVPELHLDASQFYASRDNVWNDCVARAASPSPY